MKTVKQIYLNKADLEILSKASEILGALARLGKGDSTQVMFNYRDVSALSMPCHNGEKWISLDFSNNSLGNLTDVLNNNVIIEES